MILTSKDINIALNEYSQKVYNNEPGITKIPYQSWRNLKTLASSNSSYHIEASNQNLLYFDHTKGLYKSIPVTENFIKILKRTTEMNTNSSNINAPMPSKTRRGFNLNLDFGPMNDGVAFSPYGLAVRNSKGEFYTYNPATAQTIDVTGFTFDFKGMIYRMPVAVKDIKVGDMIIHKNKPMFVTSIDNTNIEVIDILDSEIKSIIPTTNPFGFNFVTKIVSLVNFGGNAPSPDQPFGNIMPMMIASAVLGDSDGEGSMFENMDMGKLFMLNMMTNGSNPFGNLFNFNGAAETQV